LDDLETKHERHAGRGTTGREEKVLGNGVRGENKTRAMVHAMYLINSVSTAP